MLVLLVTDLNDGFSSEDVGSRASNIEKCEEQTREMLVSFPFH